MNTQTFWQVSTIAELLEIDNDSGIFRSAQFFRQPGAVQISVLPILRRYPNCRIIIVMKSSRHMLLYTRLRHIRVTSRHLSINPHTRHLDKPRPSPYNPAIYVSTQDQTRLAHSNPIMLPITSIITVLFCFPRLIDSTPSISASVHTAPIAVLLHYFTPYHYFLILFSIYPILCSSFCHVARIHPLMYAPTTPIPPNV